MIFDKVTLSIYSLDLNSPWLREQMRMAQRGTQHALVVNEKWKEMIGAIPEREGG